MQLSLQNFSTLVSNMTAAATGACSSLLDFTVGSVLRAMTESVASVALWLQWQALQVLSMTRLASSIGSDVDSFVGDFGMTRLAGVASTGSVLLSSLAPGTQSGTVAVGTILKTADGTLSFVVTRNTSNAAWSASPAGYVRLAGQASITVPVACQTLGAVGNVQAGTVSLLGQPIAGFDTVTNPNAMTGGIDPETDASVQARFVTYINTRSQGTEAAVANAILGVQSGLSYVIEENVTPAGAVQLGYFTVIVDDGSGSPPSSLLASVTTAINAVRPIGSAFAVAGPTVVSANVSMALTVNSTTTLAAADAAVNAAIVSYVNALPVGTAMPYARLSALAFGVPGVTNASNILLNGGTADIGGGAVQVVRAGTVSVA